MPSIGNKGHHETDIHVMTWCNDKYPYTSAGIEQEAGNINFDLIYFTDLSCRITYGAVGVVHTLVWE